MIEFENIKTNLIPYDQNEIEALMRQLLLKNGVTDVLYEGSNVSQLMSVMSYIIATLNVNTAANLQETILPLATKRMNILMGARQLGYEPAVKKSYRYELFVIPKFDKTIKVTDKTSPDYGKVDINNHDKNLARDIFIRKNTEFKNGTKSYWYIGEEIVLKGITNYDINHYKDANLGIPLNKMSAKIEVYEGNLITPADDPILSMTAIDYEENKIPKVRQDYIIPYKDLENDVGIRPYLSYINEEGYSIRHEEWNKTKQFLFDDTLDYNKRKFVRMENIILGFPAVFFEFAGFGNGIRTKTQIDIDVLQTSGPDGAAVGPFTTEDTAASDKLDVKTYQLIAKGIKEESSKEIKENAIVFHNTANRAVTRLDYISLAKRHTLVREADAWGGEDETPQELGNIWLSCTPADNNRPLGRVVHAATGQNTDSWERFIIKIGDTSERIDLSENQYNWSNWYLSDKEYNGWQDPNTGLIDKGLFPFLDNYKIMTMQLNYRHPLYINFSYDMSIVKYDMHKSITQTNKMVFDTVNKFFQEKIETFESEYLNSNLQRVLDTILDYNSGINYSLKLQGVLCRQMIDKFNHWKITKIDPNTGQVIPDGDQKIIVNLSYPYENLIPNGIMGEIDISVLPKIDTADFGLKQKKLHVDLNGLKGQKGSIRIAKLFYDTTIELGEYRVDLIKNIIEVEINFKKNQGLITDIFGTTAGGANENYAYFDINYSPFDNNLVNIPFAKNIMPRLKQVTFHY